ncbi:MAG: gliding motility-associated C-terminal domain-containing protein [Candidatus Latescibacteria bacterium]|nr:gliding motility-associated C-terminal domain-containing protein [Candidatus Latescibacterota bacterium]
MRKSILLFFSTIISLLLLLSGQSNVLAQTKAFLIGSEENPWRQWGSFDLVDDQSRAGWIQPIKTTRDVNILHDLYTQGRLFALEEPTESEYEPGDGRIWSPNAPFVENKQMAALLADGKQDTISFDYFNRPGKSNYGVCIYIDLGAPYPVDEVSFYPLCGEKLPLKVQQELGVESLARHEDCYMKGYALWAHDGGTENRDEWGNPEYHLLDNVPTNTDRWVVNQNFSPQHIRYIKLRCLSTMPFEIDQIEVRGEGYLRQATFTSDIIDLGDIANFGRISWAAEEEPGSQARIYTRNGRDKTTKIYYMINEIGEPEPLTEDTDEKNRIKWVKLPDDAKGPIEDDIENWTVWSPSYDFSGQSFIALGPRQFFRVKVVMESQVAVTRALMDLISVEYSQPTMARSLWGEIEPRTDVDLGEKYLFRHRVTPVIGDNDIGFDCIQIRTPIEASVETVKIGGNVVPSEEYTTLKEKNLLTVRLSNRRIASAEDTLEVSFTCAILAFGTVFEGIASASWQEDLLGQRVEVHRMEDLSVRGAVESLGRVLGSVETLPNPFTPNGDGKNDTVVLSFRLFQMIGTAPLQVEMYDLSGNRVKKLLSQTVSSDYYELTWDGTDEDGKLVPPGIYVYQILLEGDAEKFVKNGTVAVVY